MSYFKKHKEGTILTIVFHALVILILITAGFFTPLPLPEEQGVLVDFGTSNVGQGRVDPAPRPTPEPRQQQAEPVQETTPPPPQPQQPEVIPEPSESSAEELMTQDYEETAAVEEAKKKREEEERKREEEERKRREELEQKRLEDQQRQREVELERQRLAEIEKQKADSIRRIEEQRLAEQRRIAEERRQDSIRKAEEQARIDEINSRTRNAFSGSSGQNADNNSDGQGATYQGGNQGSSTGTAGAERYGLGGGEGITYDLTGRSTENLIRPDYNVQEEGVVVVQISVDKMGQVTNANAGVRGSTSLNPDLLDAARRAALSTRFNADPNAPALQTGTITYRFVLN